MRLKHIKTILVLLMVAYFIAGLRIAGDYGLGWDEPVSRLNGMLTYRYVAEGDLTLQGFRDRFYGPAFEVVLYTLEKVSGTADPFALFTLRHAATFVLFFISVVCMYLLVAGIFGGWWWGLTGALFLVLHPRIFAESFYNSKDVAFLASWVIAVFFGYRYFIKPTVGRAVCFGLAAAFATDIRIAGIFLHSIGIAVGMRIFTEKKRGAVGSFIVYAGVSLVFTILWWPALWSSPIFHFIEAVRFMTTFGVYEKDVLYMGAFLSPKEVPWHYLPVWIGITTPVSIILFWMAGAWRLIAEKRNFWKIFFITWPAGVIVLAVLFRPALYDGWRQFYFIYPAMIITALFGVQLVLRLPRVIFAVIFVVAVVNIGSAALFIIRNHPHQYVYFNELTGGMKGAEGKFDLDYWGVSYRRGLEYIAGIDSRREIKVFFTFGIGAHADVLKAQHRRFVPVDHLEDADYILSNFRWQKQKPPLPSIYEVRVDGVPVMGVYRYAL